MHSSRKFLFVLGFLIVPFAQAHSDATAVETSAEDLASCQRAADPDERIKLCTVVMESKSAIEDIRAEALLNRGLAYAEKGEERRAIADLTQAARMNPEYSALYISRGEAYARLNEVDNAIADFTTALNVDRENSVALSSRGALYLKSGKADLALRDFDVVVALEPDDPDSYASRGIAYEQAGDFKRAEADYRKAIEIEGDNQIARLGLERLRGSF